MHGFEYIVWRIFFFCALCTTQPFCLNFFIKHVLLTNLTLTTFHFYFYYTPPLLIFNVIFCIVNYIFLLLIILTYVLHVNKKYNSQTTAILIGPLTFPVANETAHHCHVKDCQGNSRDLISWGEKGAVKVYNAVKIVWKWQESEPASSCGMIKKFQTGLVRTGLQFRCLW